jgi:uncharacterized repeat protein (TIGR03803 family)
MKKLFTLLSAAFCIIMPLCAGAQGIYQFWGTTTAGGNDDQGVFFSTKYDGTGMVNYNYFMSPYSGRSWESNQPVAYNGKFYSVLTYGGINDDGIISEYDPVTNSYSTRLHLYNAGLSGTPCGMTVLGNRLYGLSSNQTGTAGILFEYNPANNTVTNRHTFTQSTGSGTYHEPIAFNGKLYGTTYKGGNNDEGVLYEYDPATGTYTVKHHFTVTLPGNNSVGLALYAGKLWGISYKKQVFSYDPASNIVSQKTDLTPLDPGPIYGRMALLNNKLYVVASTEGLHDNGFIIEYDPVLNTAQNKFDFTPATVHNRLSLLAYNGLLYGAGFFGGASGEGELFAYNPVNNTYSTLKSFNNASGGSGEGRILLYNNKMYGWLLNGGYTSGTSSLFEYNPANNQFALKLSLGGNELKNPSGQLMYYNNKLYGAAANGGTLAGGGIYAFDLQSRQFEEKVPLALTSGQFVDQGSFLLYNDKFYGVTRSGGVNGLGTLFQYDPNSNLYTKIFDFGGSAGKNPYSQLVLFNNKIYGTCSGGGTSDRGTLFEFNPANNTVAARVAFDGLNGDDPQCGLTVFHNRLFGITRSGGSNNSGTLFEYLPLPNALTKLADFIWNEHGSGPVGKLAGYDNKLWGVTVSSSQGGFAGIIYQYDLALGTLTNKKQLTAPEGMLNLAGMTMLNHKFYGVSSIGGDHGAGVLFEYDPVTNNYISKTHFEPEYGKWARRTSLAAVPAATSHGSPGSCINASSVNINASNAQQWIPFTDSQGAAIAEINANGNILGNTTVRLYVNAAATRQTPQGVFYLDRNISLTSANAPATPVSIRLYIRKTEYESLKATAGSGINAATDLVIYQNNDFCSPAIATAAMPLVTTSENWGFDYVYSTQVSTLSSFYFAKLSGVLPVRMLSFKGQVQNHSNELTWKAACTNAVEFIVERSADGIQFDSIGIKKAMVADCAHPFYFSDMAPLPVGYYRLRLTEDNGHTSYSDILLLQQNAGSNLTLQLLPNPVTGRQARLRISTSKPQVLPLSITDLAGRKLWSGQLNTAAGTNDYPLALPAMAAGIYYLHYYNGSNRETLKLVKQ